jgi:hypothetical protein
VVFAMFEHAGFGLSRGFCSVRRCNNDHGCGGARHGPPLPHNSLSVSEPFLPTPQNAVFHQSMTVEAMYQVCIHDAAGVHRVT